MAKFNQSLVKLQFKFVELNNEYMNLNIVLSDRFIPVSPAQFQTIEFYINFPTEIVLDVSGKNMNSDTVLDDQGNIIKDKHIELTKVIIDNIAVPSLYLKKWPELNGNNNSYFGFNGQFKLKFLEKNSFTFLLKTLQ